MIKIIIPLLIILFASCKQNIKQEITQKDTLKNNTSPNDSIKQDINYDLKPFQVIIKPSDDEFKKLIGDKYKQRIPDEDELEIAEVQMVRLFENMKLGTVNYLLYRSPGDFNRQYVGAENESGDKILWVNCICRSEKDNDEWKHKLIIVMGGGNCFFNFKVNITKNEYYDFKVNGNK